MSALKQKRSRKQSKTINSSPRTPKYLIIRPDGYELRWTVYPGQDECAFLKTVMGGQDAMFEGVPPVAQFASHELYCDEEGMLKELPLNAFANPFVREDFLLSMAIRGGPYGPLVLCGAADLDTNKLLECVRTYECDAEPEDARQRAESMQSAIEAFHYLNNKSK